MKRAILTLVALGVLLPLAAEVASAGGHRDRRDHEKKKVSVKAVLPGLPGLPGLTIGYTHVKDRGPRHHRDQRRVRVISRFPPRHLPILKRWVPGQHVIQERHVRQPDRHEKVWVPDRYETRRDVCGHPYRILVEEGHYVTRIIPGRVIVERVKVWVPGHWERV